MILVNKSLRLGRRNIRRAGRLICVMQGAGDKKGVKQPPLWQIEKVRWQALVCRALLLPFGGMLILLMKIWRGYKIENLPAIRAQFKDIWEEKKLRDAPLLICANHLTFIDSALIIWALASNFWYFFNYKAFTWNLPAGDFFKQKLRYHLTLYLTKCIFLDRKGTPAHKNAVLNLCCYLLEKGNVVLIFPEGQRSRTGFFENEKLRFGAGKIISSLENPQILCLYLRGDKQESFSNYPPKNSRFHLKMKLLTPVVTGEISNKRASVEVVKQIGWALKEMENEFFAETR
jgi:1-acyl-sn-glycerol-3-phosphate acyltransferase